MMILPLLAALLAPDGLYGAASDVPSPTTVEIDGRRFGAEPDADGPIGGGPGYARALADGDHVARTLDELIAALASARAGEVVFLPGDALIDCTARVLVDGLVLELPGGVTLASDRGRDGSPGALLFSDAALKNFWARNKYGVICWPCCVIQ